MLTAIFINNTGLGRVLQQDLKTERGYINRYKNYIHKSNPDITAVEFWVGDNRPYYKPEAKPYKVVQLKKAKIQ